MSNFMVLAGINRLGKSLGQVCIQFGVTVLSLIHI